MVCVVHRSLAATSASLCLQGCAAQNVCARGGGAGGLRKGRALLGAWSMQRQQRSALRARCAPVRSRYSRAATSRDAGAGFRHTAWRRLWRAVHTEREGGAGETGAGCEGAGMRCRRSPQLFISVGRAVIGGAHRGDDDEREATRLITRVPSSYRGSLVRAASPLHPIAWRPIALICCVVLGGHGGPTRIGVGTARVRRRPRERLPQAYLGGGASSRRPSF